MSATCRISKSQPGQYNVLKNGSDFLNLNASELRQLCQTMGESYAHLMAELETNEAVELTVSHRKVQTP